MKYLTYVNANYKIALLQDKVIDIEETHNQQSAYFKSYNKLAKSIFIFSSMVSGYILCIHFAPNRSQSRHFPLSKPNSFGDTDLDGGDEKLTSGRHSPLSKPNSFDFDNPDTRILVGGDEADDDNVGGDEKLACDTFATTMLYPSTIQTSKSDTAGDGKGRVCYNCLITETPAWRMVSQKDACNACGAWFHYAHPGTHRPKRLFANK
ncbi:hypothetical protein BC936DRAFT_143774 [Jimgerdemannia flammicorona]|uniref:GATA-type domain-containing protein n=1 Tax=Jimgerdemannia flammicorona TaxID=994334 RepID=A0A432ZYU2_9FUNG|nr:hypothetical protein BC936DRAFT_143774 [Jimgerdemannia flammicorona]